MAKNRIMQGVKVTRTCQRCGTSGMEFMGKDKNGFPIWRSCACCNGSGYLECDS